MPLNPYDNSRPFDVHKWSEYPQLLDAQKHLYPELFKRKNKKRMKNLRVVILDLYKCHLEDPEKYVAYHRGHDYYKEKSRYNKLHISIRTLLGVINALLKNEYAEGVKGFFDRRSGKSKLARIRALPKLITFLEHCREDNIQRPIPAHFICRHPDEEVIILKDADKKLKEYEDTDETIRMRKELRDYNALLEKTFIDIDLIGYPESIRIDTTNKRVRRIFNNGSFEQGGRFYGGWWQNVKKDLRKRIIMDESEKPTIEIDYKAIHINLLYHREGIDYFGTYGQDADPYLVRDITDDNERDIWRNFYKLVLLVCINCDSRVSAKRAIWSKIRSDDEKNKYPELKNQKQIGEAIKEFEKLHEPIAEHFYSGGGLELQRLDSIIAEKVIKHFVSEKKLPILCIHDSFICTTRDSYHLEKVIQSAMIETLNEMEKHCPITPLTKTKDRRITEEIVDPDNPFSRYSIEDIFEEDNANGSYSPRIKQWREQRIQTIINYKSITNYI